MEHDKTTGQFLPRIHLSKEYLIEEYVNKKRSADSIALDNGCTGGVILSGLRQYGIPRRKAGTYRAGTARDLTKRRFGRLLVEHRHPTSKDKDRWVTKCDCGRLYVCRGHNLVHDIVTQCRDCSCPTLGCGYVTQAAWGDIVRGTRKRRMTLELSIEEANEVFTQQNGRCALSGVPIQFARKRRDHVILRLSTASLDRIDPTVGYVRSNVQWVHKLVNLMKQQMNDADFIAWCEKIVTYHSTKQAA